jgi:hypothetical protein
MVTFTRAFHDAFVINLKTAKALGLTFRRRCCCGPMK